MTGFIIDQQTADTILSGIAAAFDSRGVPKCWQPYLAPVVSGPLAGAVFLSAPDELPELPMREGQKLHQYPEFAAIVTLLGGMESRTEIDPSILEGAV